MIPVYDSIEGIEMFYLTDGLAGLNRLIKDRKTAGYDRKERLHDFVIMGRWSTDACGNFGRCEFQLDYEPIKLPKDLPRVMRTEDAYKRVVNVSLTTYSSSDVPPSHVFCPECKKNWSIDNAHDTHVDTSNRVVPLTPGKTIRDRELDWVDNSEGVFRFGPEPSVRNAKFINLAPHPEYKDQAVNEKGWRYRHPPFNHERITQDYVAEEGDP